MNLSVRTKVKALAGNDIVTAALFVQFLTSVAFGLIGSFMPLFINSDLGESLIDATYWTAVIQLISSCVMAITAPFWGWMCDRFGPKRIMLTVLTVNTVVFACMAFSTSVLHIIIFRSLQSAFGGFSTVMFSLVALVSPPGQLKKVLSYQIAAMTVGQLMSPGIGGGLAVITGYRLTLIASSLMFIAIIPVAYRLRFPKVQKGQRGTSSFNITDVKALMPDAVALVLIYICIGFIVPIIPWNFEFLGVPNDQLLIYTTITTVLNAAAFAVATPLLSSRVSVRALPILSIGAAFAIEATAFAVNPIAFLALRIAIGGVQAGIPPNLLGGKSGRKGTGMGILNSARFVGMGLGPFLATTILGDGKGPRPLFMYTGMAAISVTCAIFLYATHTKDTSSN